MLNAKLTARASSICARDALGAYVVRIHPALASQLPEHLQRRAQRLSNRRRACVSEGGRHAPAVAVSSRRHGRVRLDAELRTVRLGDERRHQPAIAGRPGGRPAHRFVRHAFHRTAVEVRAIHDQLHDVAHPTPRRFAGHARARRARPRARLAGGRRPAPHRPRPFGSPSPRQIERSGCIAGPLPGPPAQPRPALAGRLLRPDDESSSWLLHKWQFVEQHGPTW